jgi:hypothetical protein
MRGAKRPIGARSARAGKSPAQLEREIREVVAELPEGVEGVEGVEGAEVAVVVVWIKDTQEIAPGQRPWRHDLGERPKFVDAKRAHAAMWVNRGTRADLDKARAWATREHPGSGRAYAYPVAERDPLGRARRDAIAGRRSS